MSRRAEETARTNTHMTQLQRQLCHNTQQMSQLLSMNQLESALAVASHQHYTNRKRLSHLSEPIVCTKTRSSTIDCEIVEEDSPGSMNEPSCEHNYSSVTPVHQTTKSLNLYSARHVSNTASKLSGPVYYSQVSDRMVPFN